MKKWKAITVSSRADGRADSRPLRFMWEEHWMDVEKVLDSWLEQGPDPIAPVYRVFRVLCAEGEYFLRVEDGAWLWQGTKC